MVSTLANEAAWATEGYLYQWKKKQGAECESGTKETDGYQCVRTGCGPSVWG